MSKKELIPIAGNSLVINVDYASSVISKKISEVSDLLISVANVSDDYRAQIATNSKIINNRKKELGITKEMETVISYQVFNSILGSISSKSFDTSIVNDRLEKEYNTMGDSFKKIVMCLYDNKEISQKVLADKLGLTSASITKQFNKNKKNDFFVKVYRLNNRVVYYSLFDEARKFLKDVKKKNKNEYYKYNDSYNNQLENEDSDVLLINYKYGEYGND